MPFFLIAAGSSGWLAYAAMLAFMVFVFGAIPFIDAMIVQYVDDRYRSRVAGVRLAVAFGVSSLAVYLLGPTVKAGGFGMLLMVLAALSTFTALCVTLLPGRIPIAAPAPTLAAAVVAPTSLREIHVMKITAVTPFVVDPGSGKNWLFVKVETAAGLHGWGECYTQADRDRAIARTCGSCGRYLVGRDAARDQALHALRLPRLRGQARRDGVLLARSAASSRRSGTSPARRWACPYITCSAGRAASASASTPTAGRAATGPARGGAARRRPGGAAASRRMKFDPFPGPWRDAHLARTTSAPRRGEPCARCARRWARTSTC